MSEDGKKGLTESIVYIAMGLGFIAMYFVLEKNILTTVIFAFASLITLFFGIKQVVDYINQNKEDDSEQTTTVVKKAGKEISASQASEGIRAFFANMFMGGEDQIIDSVLENQNAADTENNRIVIREILQAKAERNELKFNAGNRTYSELM